MAIRFIIYGMLGWIVEILFTGTGSALSGSLRLTGFTYLWMFPIYGLAILLEPVHDYIRYSPWFIRGIIWVCVIFFIEYLSGWAIKNLIGICPWDYSGLTEYSIDGFIRLDFVPFWFVAGLGFEKIHDLLDNILERLANTYR
ncbi:MAG: putative ABC transporter permease [Syntrophomonadaceae bacterium]|jgi:uncharacterized membrane protein